ncbi:MAG: branched-chain amino acid ABC transporter permease [Promethearchaeota archaeon]|jgi:branched-chain amino acid transport system permease protein
MVVEEIIIFGTVQGAIFALLALGYSLVYGVGGILNLGHGGYYIIATYTFYLTWLIVGGTFGFLLGMLYALIAAAITGAASYFIIIKPLKEAPISILIGTFAVGFFIEQLVMVVYDPKFHTIPPLFDFSIDILGIRVQLQYIIIIFLGLLIVILVTIFINKSKLGKSIRAVSQDPEAAMLMGINADRVLMITVILSAVLAGVASILNTPVDVIAPYIGWRVLTGAIAVVTLGGMGSLPGSIVGAFILGYARLITDYLIDPVYSSLIPVIIIILILVFRPRGLFGKKEIY